MSNPNLPRGVTTNDLHGNTIMDNLWETFHENVDEDTERLGMSPKDARLAWSIGLQVFKMFADELEES